ncbi:hypothetical protein ACH40F_08350 [Streptomyces sp. NPDC020794]|uniref:hypothetical protein n=1 Tax=unclassified Streptomyces TaxID=2593676 RepID=UPI0036E0AB12
MTTQTTDSGAQAVLALRSMEANAFRVSQVTTRLLDEHTDLPPLIDVRPQATATAATLDLQTLTIDAARAWAAALGAELKVREQDELSGRMADANLDVDGVTVHVCAFTSFTAQERAERAAAAVAA